MINSIQKYLILAILMVATVAVAGNPPAYSISFNDKGGNIVIAGEKLDSKVEALSVSINEPRMDTATAVAAKFCWRDGAQAPDGSFREMQSFDCVKRTVAGKTIWVANVERLRTEIVDTAQQLSFFFEATMPNGSKLYTRIALGTIANGICSVHVDEGLPFRLGVTYTRPEDNSHQIEILAREGAKK